jgi:cell division protein FtsW
LFGTQPSEFAKFSLIVVLAVYCARNQSRMKDFVPGILGGAGIAVPIIALVLKEPDRGTAALMMLVTIALLLLAGARGWYLVPPAILFGGALAAMIVFSPMARNRIDAWINPANHKDGAAQQARKGLFAFGQGGIEGQGLGRGRLKYNVPEVHTDFILPAVGEELGLPFTLGVVAAYGVILFCGIRIARRAPDTLGLLLAAGITFLIAAQACINIGVVTTVLPNKGMPLPFVSRGGTSMAVLLAMVGALVAVARQAGPDDATPAVARSRRVGSRGPFAPDTDFAGAA